ncbi:MAG: hypothetical protein H7331_00120 [Bacteroidia bacterium]|nr:hypothetical protein [Bacteroidia bacterium]
MQKLIVLFLILIYYTTPQSLAQVQCEGIYVTAADYSLGKLSYQSTHNKFCKLRVHELTRTATIKLISKDTAITLLKNNVFGYRDNQKINYRFYNNKSYEMVSNSKSIMLYKTTLLTGNKGAETIDKFFFSITTNSPLYALTIQNLKNEFANNTSFIAALDLYFKTNNELLNYDTFHKQYTLHYVYALTNKLSN